MAPPVHGVVVAETNRQPTPEDDKGLKGWLMSKVMTRAGVPSADRITNHHWTKSLIASGDGRLLYGPRHRST